MSLSYEFSKIKGGFKKVKEDIHYLRSSLETNYSSFKKKHDSLSSDLHFLSQELKSSLNTLKTYFLDHQKQIDLLTPLKSEVKELKLHLEEIQQKYMVLSEELHHRSSKNKTKSETSFNQLNEKVHNTELEMYLLKERMVEKDLEIKQMKEINRRLFEIVEDLAKTEKEIVQGIK